jgi:hypothetical protein
MGNLLDSCCGERATEKPPALVAKGRFYVDILTTRGVVVGMLIQDLSEEPFLFNNNKCVGIPAYSVWHGFQGVVRSHNPSSIDLITNPVSNGFYTLAFVNSDSNPVYKWNRETEMSDEVLRTQRSSMLIVGDYIETYYKAVVSDTSLMLMMRVHWTDMSDKKVYSIKLSEGEAIEVSRLESGLDFRLLLIMRKSDNKSLICLLSDAAIQAVPDIQNSEFPEVVAEVILVLSPRAYCQSLGNGKLVAEGDNGNLYFIHGRDIKSLGPGTSFLKEIVNIVPVWFFNEKTNTLVFNKVDTSKCALMDRIEVLNTGSGIEQLVPT